MNKSAQSGGVALKLANRISGCSVYIGAGKQITPCPGFVGSKANPPIRAAKRNEVVWLWHVESLVVKTINIIN